MTTDGEYPDAGDARIELGPKRRAVERYWLIHPNGGRQLIDPRRFELDRLAEQARLIGGRLVVEGETFQIQSVMQTSVPSGR